MRPLTILPASARLEAGNRLASRCGEFSLYGVNTSKNRTVASIVLGLAITALVVDKVFLGGGATPTLAADAALVPTTPPSAGAAKPAAAGDLNVRSVAMKVDDMAERLDLETGPQLADAFAPPRALAEVVEAELARQRLAERQTKAREQAATLREQLKLTATVTTGASKAMINGTLYALGAELPGTGFRVKEIDRAGVLLEDTATQATVRLDLLPNR